MVAGYADAGQAARARRQMRRMSSQASTRRRQRHLPGDGTVHRAADLLGLGGLGRRPPRRRRTRRRRWRRPARPSRPADRAAVRRRGRRTRGWSRRRGGWCRPGPPPRWTPATPPAPGPPDRRRRRGGGDGGGGTTRRARPAGSPAARPTSTRPTTARRMGHGEALLRQAAPAGGAEVTELAGQGLGVEAARVGAGGAGGVGRHRGGGALVRRGLLLGHVGVGLGVGCPPTGRGLEGDPAVLAQPHLGPGVGVLALDQVAVRVVRVLDAGGEADRHPGRQAGGAGHRRERAGELLAVAPAHLQEVDDGVVTVALGHVLVVHEPAGVAEERLQGQRLVVGGRLALGDVGGQQPDVTAERTRAGPCPGGRPSRASPGWPPATRRG